MAEDSEETELRRAAHAVSIPKLEELRGRVRTMRTSDLIGYLINPQMMHGLIATEEGEEEMHLVAAVLTLTDEIDRRVPVPTEV